MLLFSTAVLNHAREHVNIPKCTEYFRAYTDLRNQGATNTNDTYIDR